MRRHLDWFVAAVDIKSEFDKANYEYAVKKVESVRKLKRTSASSTHIQGRDKKQLFDIVGGILTKASGSKRQFDEFAPDSELSIILCLERGIKVINDQEVEIQDGEPILAFFLLKFIEKLRHLGSVPALEVDDYLIFMPDVVEQEVSGSA